MVRSNLGWTEIRHPYQVLLLISPANIGSVEQSIKRVIRKAQNTLQFSGPRCIHVSCHIYMRKTESTEDVHRWFAEIICGLWPVAVGSLSLRKGPCIRSNCSACKSGEGHSSYSLYGRQGNRRFSIYVPEKLVPEVRAAVQNGRKLQELVNQAGLRYVRALKRKYSQAK